LSDHNFKKNREAEEQRWRVKNTTNSGDFQSIPITFEKIWDIITDLRHAICDLQRAWWCGDQRNAHASKCLLRRQTTSQRDIVHQSPGCPPSPRLWRDRGCLSLRSNCEFQGFPMISNQFQSLFKK
jgi:hypothetical protein